jgi:hypothetical protein
MITIDTREIENLCEDLIKIHRAALPNAVRNTLNDLAFDVKARTLSDSVVSAFDNLRNPTLFKKYSGVLKAQGWEIKKMQSTVGMIHQEGATKVVSRLEEQEEGGTLRHNYIPTDIARVGGLHKGKVLKNRWTGNITKFAHIPYGDRQALIRQVTGWGIKSGGKGKGAAILYGNTLYEVKGFKRFRKTNSIELHFDRIYTYKKNRQVKIKPTHFVRNAALKTGVRVQEFFNKNAEKQLAKFRNR